MRVGGVQAPLLVREGTIVATLGELLLEHVDVVSVPGKEVTLTPTLAPSRFKRLGYVSHREVDEHGRLHVHVDEVVKQRL